MRRARLGVYSSANIILQSCYQIAVVFVLGLGRAADIYFAAVTIAAFFVALIYSVVTFAVMPNLTRMSEVDIQDRIPVLLGCALLFLPIPIVTLAALAICIGPSVFPSFVPDLWGDYTGATFCELLSAYFSSIAIVLSLQDQVSGGFSRIESCNLISGLAGLCLLVAVYVVGGSVVMIGAVDVARSIILVIALLAITRCLPRFRCDVFAKIWPLFIGANALIAGNIFAKAVPLVDKALASQGLPGEVAVLHIIQQVSAAAQRFFSKVVTIPGLVALTAIRGEAGRIGAYRRELRVSLALSVAFYLGGLILVSFCQYWLPQFFSDIPQSGSIMVFLYAASALFIAGPCGQVSASFFYSRGDTRTPMRVSAVGAVFGLAVRFILYGQYGAAGLLLGLGMHQLFNFVCLDRLVYRQDINRESGFVS